jgi:bla regulator protein blaR1
MSQALLADRFKLEVHRETREMPVYTLLPAKGGLNLSLTGPPSNDWVRAQIGRGSLVAKLMPTAQVISILGGILHREVLDESGIDGVFDIALDWAPDDVAANPVASGGADKPSISPRCRNKRDRNSNRERFRWRSW